MRDKFMRLTALSLLLLPLRLAAQGLTVTSGYIPVAADGQLYYEECGSGEAVIFIHGYTLDRRMWNPQFEVFGQNYRAIRMDLRGYGKSTDEAEGMRFTHMDDVLTLMDSLKIDSAYIVGLSMGGFIAGDILGMHPERVKKCVLACGTITYGPGPNAGYTASQLAKKRKTIAQRKKQGKEAYKRQRVNGLLSCCAPAERERISGPIREMVMEWSGWQAFNIEPRIYYGQIAFNSLVEKRPETPVMFMYGKYDCTFSTVKDRMMSYLKNSLSVVMDTGHMVNMEDPEAFNFTVISFFEGS